VFVYLLHVIFKNLTGLQITVAPVGRQMCAEISNFAKKYVRSGNDKDNNNTKKFFRRMAIVSTYFIPHKNIFVHHSH